MAKGRIRMADVGEIVPPDQAVSVVQSPLELDYREAEFRNTEGNAKLDIQRTQSRLRYLFNLKQDSSASSQSGSVSSDTDAIGLEGECPCCAEQITLSRPLSMMGCGHRLCKECIEKLKFVSRGLEQREPDVQTPRQVQSSTVRRQPVGAVTFRHVQKVRIKCPWCRIVHSVEDLQEVALVTSPAEVRVRFCNVCSWLQASL